MTLPDFYDITWTRRNGRPQLKLLTDAGTEYHEFPFRPYCYVQERDVDQDVLRRIYKVDETASLEEVTVGQAMVRADHHEVPETFYDTSYYKIQVSDPKCIRSIRRELEQLGVETLQSDVPYARRVMIDLDQTVSSPDRILSFDIEVESTGGFPDADEAKERIYTICAVGSDGEEFIFADDDERITIEGFLDVAEDYRAIMGWNSFKFDYPYLVNRCDRLDIDFDWFQVTHVDALPTYQYILLLYQQNYRLETVARAEFGVEYDDVDYSEMRNLFWEDRERLIEYNMEDARVVARLNEKYKFKEITFDILAAEGFCRPHQIFFLREDLDYQRVTKSSNILIEGIVLSLSDDVIWPNKGASRQSFEGAKVLEPKPGRYDAAVTLDFSSMYPSIISALNIGPETFRPDGSGDIQAPIGSFIRKPQSIFSKAYHILKDQRDEYTEQMRRFTRGTPEWTIASSYSKGIKQYVNTFYGVIGSPYSRFYNRDVAENITKMGQAMLMRTAEFAEECGYTVIYGDTDSVLIELTGDGDPVEEAQMLSRLFSAEIRRFVRQEYNGDPELIYLTVDEVYAPFFITDAKKRYAGYCIYDGEPCFTYEKTGFESVRGDWPTASQNFQDDILHAILDDRDVWETVEGWKDRLFSGELDRDLVKHVGLRQAPDRYDSMPPHVRVAGWYQGTEDEFRVGDKVPYIKYGNSPEEVAAVIDGELRVGGEVSYIKYDGDPEGEIIDEPLTLTHTNYVYLWEKMFQSILDRFGIERTEKMELSDFA